MLKKIVLAIVLAFGAFAGYVALQPDRYTLTRSIVVDATPDRVFPHINDFRKWDAWSPWAKLDPNAKGEHSGAASGKGAVFRWSGNDKVGEGSMTIVDSRPSEAVGIKLVFAKPMEGESDASFVLKPEGAATRVTWSLAGRNGFVGRLICTAMGAMERIIGPDYERGLANLKGVAEGQKS